MKIRLTSSIGVNFSQMRLRWLGHAVRWRDKARDPAMSHARETCLEAMRFWARMAVAK